MNYQQRINTYTDRGQMWAFAYHALGRLTARVVDGHIERSVYLRDRGRLDEAVQRRDAELMSDLYNEHLGSSRGGTAKTS